MPWTHLAPLSHFHTGSSREGLASASSPEEYTRKYPNIKTIDYEASLSNLQHENATLRQENEKVKQVVAP